jgi:imidazolonepropionase-like amidohydrolase
VVTHTVTANGARIAAQAGVNAVVHGIGDTLVDQALGQLMVRRETAYVPTLVVYEPQQDRAFLPQERALMRPRDQMREDKRDAGPVAPIPLYESRRWTIMQENVRRLKAAGVRIGVGTDAGIGGVYHGWATLREIRWLTKLGLSPAEALAAATGESARIIGKERIQGRIAPGYVADLLLVGGQPDQRIDDLYDLRHVFVAGREMSLSAARQATAADTP